MGFNPSPVVTDVIAFPSDYNVELNLSFLKRSDKEILHSVEDGTIRKAIRTENSILLIRIVPRDDAFEIQYEGRPSANDRRHTVEFVREWFDLDTDLKPFYQMAKKDSLLSEPVKRFKGYRIVGAPDLFESLCWAVIGQQINLAFAYTLKQRFVSNFGEHIARDEKKYYLFPTPSVVAGLGDGDLLPLQFSRQKSKYVRLIAEAFENKIVSREIIAQLPFHEARQQLMSIKGVGNWTANYALMKTFRYREAFPLEDAGLHNAIRNLKKMKTKPTVDQVKRLFKKYKGWEAYATLYLWKTL